MSEYLVYYVFLINFNSNHGCRQYEPRHEKSENVAVCYETTRTSMNMSKSRGGQGSGTPGKSHVKIGFLRNSGTDSPQKAIVPKAGSDLGARKITSENMLPSKFWYGLSSIGFFMSSCPHYNKRYWEVKFYLLSKIKDFSCHGYIIKSWP